MFGIEDPLVLVSYLLCIAGAVLCVIYGLLTRNRGGEKIDIDDARWVQEEKQVEEEVA
jgi:hypothetical protein